MQNEWLHMKNVYLREEKNVYIRSVRSVCENLPFIIELNFAWNLSEKWKLFVLMVFFCDSSVRRSSEKAISFANDVRWHGFIDF